MQLDSNTLTHLSQSTMSETDGIQLTTGQLKQLKINNVETEQTDNPQLINESNPFDYNKDEIRKRTKGSETRDRVLKKYKSRIPKQPPHTEFAQMFPPWMMNHFPWFPHPDDTNLTGISTVPPIFSPFKPSPKHQKRHAGQKTLVFQFGANCEPVAAIATTEEINVDLSDGDAKPDNTEKLAILLIPGPVLIQIIKYLDYQSRVNIRQTCSYLQDIEGVAWKTIRTFHFRSQLLNLFPEIDKKPFMFNTADQLGSYVRRLVMDRNTSCFSDIDFSIIPEHTTAEYGGETFIITKPNESTILTAFVETGKGQEVKALNLRHCLVTRNVIQMMSVVFPNVEILTLPLNQTIKHLNKLSNKFPQSSTPSLQRLKSHKKNGKESTILSDRYQHFLSFILQEFQQLKRLKLDN